MLKKQHAPFSFLLALLLFFSFTFPTEAATPQSPTLMWEKDLPVDNWEFPNLFPASNNDNFIAVPTTKYDGFKNVYQVDVMKVDAKGTTILDLKFEANAVKFTEFDGQSVMAAISFDRQVLELYNEELELIESKALPDFPETHTFIDLHIQDDVLTVQFVDSAYNDHILVHYNITDLSPVNDVEFPLKSYTSYMRNGDLLIQGESTIGMVIDEITVSANDLFGDFATEPIEFWRSSSLVEQDGYLYAAIPFHVGDNYPNRNSFTGLYKIDKNGKVLKKKFTKASKVIQVGNNFFGFENLQYVYYDIELTKKPTVIATVTEDVLYPSLTKVADDLFAYPVNNEVIFANGEGKKQFSHQSDNRDSNYYSPINEQYFSGWDNGSYLYDTKTGERADIVLDSLYSPVLYGDKIAVANANTVKMYTTAPLKVEDLSTKKWTITFNQDVNGATISEKTIYVVNDESGKKVDGLTFTTKGNQVIVHPPKNGYEKDTNYTLHVTDDVLSTKDIKLKEAKTKAFFVK